MSVPEAPTGRVVVDNSVWQRLSNPAVRAAFEEVVTSLSPTEVLTCPPVVAEVGFSARNGVDHDRVCEELQAFPPCHADPSVALVLHLQNALFNGGFVRGVGALDTVIAAYALANDAMVLHYDRDFEFVAAVRSDFRHHWIVPAGSVD